MWKDKHGNQISLLDTVSFTKDGTVLIGRVFATVEGDNILTVKIERGKYFDVKDKDCELINHSSSSSSYSSSSSSS